MITKYPIVKCDQCETEFNLDKEGSEGYIQLQKVYHCQECFDKLDRWNEEDSN